MNNSSRLICSFVILLISAGVIAEASTLFPTTLPSKEWIHFTADGFSEPACGVIYRAADTVVDGLAVGGIDTGCLDIETSGLWGYCTIFNTLTPRRGPLNTPILGLSVNGETWVLAKEKVKMGGGRDQIPVEPVFTDLDLDAVNTVEEIHYWGHYPVADLEFETSAPVRVGMRCWSPFLPGDVKDSVVPAIICEVHLRNPSDSKQEGTIAFSFPGPTLKEAAAEKFKTDFHEQERQLPVPGPGRTASSEDPFKSIKFVGEKASYAISVLNEEYVRFGGDLGGDGQRWAAIAEELPPVAESSAAGSAAVDFSLDAGEERVVRFLLTWCAPMWNGRGYEWADRDRDYTHMYCKFYPDPITTAQYINKHHVSLLKRVLAWQQVVYSDDTLPVWLRDSLVNSLYMMSECSVWAQKKPPLGDWVKEEDGIFGLNECPRACPQIECLPCSFYGSLPVTYLFPELQLSTIRAYKNYQREDGCPPWIFGTYSDVDAPEHNEAQCGTNGISLAAIVDRFLMCDDTDDLQYTNEFYPMIKKALEYTVFTCADSNPEFSEGEQFISMPRKYGPNEWFEAEHPGWFGCVAHVGLLHLAQARITERMAKQVGDQEYAEKCARLIELGAQAMEDRLWDERGYYLNYWDHIQNIKSEYVFGYQMDGEWITDHHGLPSALPEERVRKTLETIKRVNVALSRSAAVNYAFPDGNLYEADANNTGLDYGRYSYFPPEAFMLSMNYMYEDQVTFGTELARKMWHNIVCIQGYTWDAPNIMRGDTDTGERTFGNDYYQDMIIWSLPAAIQQKDVAWPTRDGGLVDRILKAASNEN